MHPKPARSKELTTGAAALVEWTEQGSRAIARELHDDITQRLAIVTTEIARMLAFDTDTPAATIVKLQSLQQQVSDVSEAIREISHRVYPSILDELGLPTALEALCSEVQQAHGIASAFRAGPLPQIPQQAASCLYFVARESLQIVTGEGPRHASENSQRGQTQSVWVGLTAHQPSGMLLLQVIESGAGFDSEPVSRLRIEAMKERVRIARGKITITTEPGEGSRVEVTLPVAAEPSEVPQKSASR